MAPWGHALLGLPGSPDEQCQVGLHPRSATPSSLGRGQGAAGYCAVAAFCLPYICISFQGVNNMETRTERLVMRKQTTHKQ